MKSEAKTALRVTATILGMPVAFYLGVVATAHAYDRWYVPSLVKRYPHDGQIGLEMLVVSLLGGAVGAIVALILGVIWIHRAARRAWLASAESQNTFTASTRL